jgi:hypothetical protein
VAEVNAPERFGRHRPGLQAAQRDLHLGDQLVELPRIFQEFILYADFQV